MTTKQNNKKGYVHYNYVIRSKESINTLKANGYEYVYTTSITKVVLGSVCIVVAIVPNGLAPLMYPLGLSLLLSGGIDLAYIKANLLKKWRILKCRF